LGGKRSGKKSRPRKAPMWMGGNSKLKRNRRKMDVNITRPFRPRRAKSEGDQHEKSKKHTWNKEKGSEKK